MANTAAVARGRPRGRGVADGLQRLATALGLIAACATALLMAAKAVCDHVDGLQDVGVFLGE
jgi:hypothetical protein